MIKNLMLRLSGVAMIAFGFAPAMVAVLKTLPVSFSAALCDLYHPLWLWECAWRWTPALRLPMESWGDLGSSIPGLLALSSVGIGLVIVLQKEKRPPRRRWEDKP
jgi:hypothetical protein